MMKAASFLLRFSACCLMFSVWASGAAAQPPAPGSPERVHYEAPDDPPAPTAARDDPDARSAGGFYRRGAFVSIQVNVDEFGQNITGDAANEPSLAIDPNDPSKIVIGWRQFDNVASNFRQGGWAYSNDAGASWTFPGVLEPAVFRSDPVLDVDSQGVFHYNSLKDDFSMDVWRSLTSGQSWLTPVPAFGGDKNWIAIDRTGGTGEGHVYGTWQRFFNCCGANIFTRSTDGAASFESPVAVTNSPSFGTITVGPDGTVYASGVREQQFGTFVVSRSLNARDAGVTPTFSGTVVDMGGSMSLSAAPNPAGLLGQAQVVVDASGGPTDGNVYLLSSVDPSGSDPMDVHISRSEDGGSTWSAPIQVNDDTSNSNWQWFGTVSVAPNGRLDVVWNDTRNSGQATVSELFYAFSTDGGDTWSPNVAVSPSFNSTVGWPNQNKIGDYYDMESDDAGASIAYSATFNGEQDVYYLRVFPDANPVTVTFESIAAEDGWVRESGENTNVGGNRRANGAGNLGLRLGDNKRDRQYKTVLSFDTSSIPAGATIQSATLRLRRKQVQGINPFTSFGSALADIASGAFGGNSALEVSDFQAAATATAVATMSSPPAFNSYSEGVFNGAGLAAINPGGRTQLRVSFVVDDNDNGTIDVMGFKGGEAVNGPSRPQLVVTYVE